MHVDIHKMDSKWPEIAIAIRKEEIDKLCVLLRQLQTEKRDHFHIFRSNFDGDRGIMDIEFSLNDTASENMACDW